MKNYMRASEANKIAKEVNNVSEENNGEILEEIVKEINKKAKDGKFELVIRNYGFGNGSYYGSGLTDNQKAILNKLNELGYKTKMVVEERQLVDIYLKIDWNEA